VVYPHFCKGSLEELAWLLGNLLTALDWKELMWGVWFSMGRG
jgi:hypothetical protein